MTKIQDIQIQYSFEKEILDEKYNQIIETRIEEILSKLRETGIDVHTYSYANGYQFFGEYGSPMHNFYKEVTSVVWNGYRQFFPTYKDVVEYMGAEDYKEGFECPTEYQYELIREFDMCCSYRQYGLEEEFKE